MPITLQQALALPQGNYKTVWRTPDFDLMHTVAADAHCAVITRRAGIMNAGAVIQPMQDNLGIAIENLSTHTLVVAHAANWEEGLKEAIRLATIDKDLDMLRIHLVGTLHGTGREERSEKDWTARMKKVIAVINDTPNATLKTFDVGQKPHPVTFAVAQIGERTFLVRGTPDIKSYHGFNLMTGLGGLGNIKRTAHQRFNRSNPLGAAHMPPVSRDFTPDSDSGPALCVTYDDRIRGGELPPPSKPPRGHGRG